MNPTAASRRRALRWLVPTGVAAVASVIATGMVHAGETRSSRLPRMTPAALLAEVKDAPATGFSGTVLTRVSLGLPDLPALGIYAGDGDGDDSTSLLSLLSGSHTVQVWYGGADEQRIALLGAMDETDFFRSGRQVWTWDSSNRVAEHAELPAGTGTQSPDPSVAPTLSPNALSSQVLAAVSPTTAVQVSRGGRIADRNTYDMTLVPRTSATRIASVRISVDASTKLPLAVRVYARGATTPAIDVAFTSVRFTAPAKSFFTFSPPSGATVRKLRIGSGLQTLAGLGVHVLGTGWTRIVELDTGAAANTIRAELGAALTPVSGAWGSGGLLESSLVSVLVTSKGRVLAGAVDPTALYAAAATG